MGYYLQAIIGKQQTLTRGVSQLQHARVVPLAQGLAIIPLTDELHDEIGDDGETHCFCKLSPGVEKWARCISAVQPVAYLEAEFFGDAGGQSAVAWMSGSRVLGPLHSLDAINETLRFLGVRSEGAYDEFDSVGLGRHRDTDDWIAEAIPRP